MEYLVLNHHGGFYISDGDPEEIEKACAICGCNDHIVLSWEKGNVYSTIKNYFSTLPILKEDYEYYKNIAGISKEEVSWHLDDFHEDSIDILFFLADDNQLTKKECIMLAKILGKTMRKSQDLVEKVYSNDIVRVLKKGD